MDSKFYLRKANALFLAMCESVDSYKDIDRKIDVIEFAAILNSHFHTGRYSSHDLEVKLKQIGATITRDILKVPLGLPRNGSKVLHIATALQGTGGHTRLMENYIKADPANTHFLFITAQRPAEIPKRVLENEGIMYEQIFTRKESAVRTAQYLYSIVDNFDVVVLHQYPHDPIPLLALSNGVNVPVIYVNHADHGFWLGASLANVCINIRDFAAWLSRTRRGIQNNVVLPVPVSKSNNGISKEEARRILGIGTGEKMFLTMASFYKFIPIETHNYFATINKILTFDEQANFYVIGVPEQKYLTLFDQLPDPRIHLLNEIEDPTLYQIAADHYLESMPHNSLTSLLESILLDCYPLMIFDPPSTNMVNDVQIEFGGLIHHPKNEAEYLENIKRILSGVDNEKNKMTLDRLKASLAQYSSLVYWNTMLKEVYKEVLVTPRPGLLAITEYNESDAELTLNALMIGQIRRNKYNLFAGMAGWLGSFRLVLKVLPSMWYLTFADNKLRFLVAFLYQDVRSRIAGKTNAV